MMSNATLNPAELAAQEALEKVYYCIENNDSFILEAGAGAGKTYSLIEVLKELIIKRGQTLQRACQQIACITFTNTAKDEIDERIDNHPVVYTGTIHSFFWAAIKRFQSSLLGFLPELPIDREKKWKDKLKEEEIDNISEKKLIYDELGRRRINVEDNTISLHHDDVLGLTICLLKEEKFKKLFVSSFPVLLIDEYQDTDKELVKAITEAFLDEKNHLLIGFFGDHWQKIYGTGCGKIEHDSLVKVGKEANFRSVKTIVDCLNKLRPDLPQASKDENSVGSINIFHTNTWEGERRTGAGGHWTGDLPAEKAKQSLNLVRTKLESLTGAEKWDFSPENTKILVLTHKVLAREQGYSNLANVFRYPNSYIKKEEPFIKYFADVIEPACKAYIDKQYGKMFDLLGYGKPIISKPSHKQKWSEAMDKLIELRDNSSIGDVIEHLIETGRPLLPEKLYNTNLLLNDHLEGDALELTTSAKNLKKLRSVSYKEIISLTEYIEGHTPFNTKHGVKGREYENVLVILGRGWNQYNFNQLLEWSSDIASIPANKIEDYEKNRNLFYVACSRPKKRLALLFTQKLSDISLETLGKWFGIESISEIDLN